MNPVQKIQEPDLILFGGAFDPPHKGHSECLQFVKEHFPKADICVVPSLLTPSTNSKNKIPTAHFDDRLEMCRLAFGAQGFKILDIEKNLPSPSYTIQTLRKLKDQFPKKNLAFVMGLDQLQSFHLWSEPLKILEIASLIVVPREANNLESVVKTCAEHLGISIHKLSDSYLEWGNLSPLFYIKKIPKSVSSTDLRKKIQSGSEISEDFLDSKILRYIQKKSLYK